MSNYKDYNIESDKGEASNAENPDLLGLAYQESFRFGQDTEHRRWLVEWMMLVVSIWLAVVLLITALSENTLHIDTKVLCVLLATTTINVLGLSKIILNGLFGYSKYRSNYRRKQN